MRQFITRPVKRYVLTVIRMALQQFLHYYQVANQKVTRNLGIQLQKIATEQTVEYIQSDMKYAIYYGAGNDILVDCVKFRFIDGMIMEFGVWTGRSIRVIGELVDQPVYGFDSFKGLPEAWPGYIYPLGSFDVGGEPPKDSPDNVEFVVGFFDETVEDFVATHEGSISFMHIDADLYSSTKTIFNAFRERIIPGTVILFDEYFNYHGWKDHEFKAFKEFVEEEKAKYTYLAFKEQKVAVRIDEIRGEKFSMENSRLEKSHWD